MGGSRTAKRRSLAEAISRGVHDGDTVFLSGMQHGEPSAAIHEILRQGQHDLSLIPQLPDTAQLLLAEGQVSLLISGYTSGLYPRRGYVAQRIAAQNIELVELSHGGLGDALSAGASGLPFGPTLSHLGTNYPKHADDYIATVACPFTGSTVGAVRALRPDVAIIHVQRADEFGNAQKHGSLGMDLAGVRAAGRVIVTTEKIVDHAVIQASAQLTVVPGFLVEAVVEVPWGAWPQHLAGCYDDDFAVWLGVQANEEFYLDFLRRCVRGVTSRDELMALIRQERGDAHLELLTAAATSPNAALADRLDAAGPFLRRAHP